MESEYLLSVMQCMYHVHNCTDIREEKKSCVDFIDVNVVVVVFFLTHTVFSHWNYVQCINFVIYQTNGFAINCNL